MKINTKHKHSTTPIKKCSHSYYHANQYIPNASIRDLDEDQEVDSRGRIIRYETILITTPVLTSARTENRNDVVSKKAKRLNKDDVEALTSKLNSLYIRDQKYYCKSKKKTGDESDRKNQQESAPSTDISTFLGRCSLVIYNSATKGFIEVIRSARLAFKNYWCFWNVILGRITGR